MLVPYFKGAFDLIDAQQYLINTMRQEDEAHIEKS